MIGSELVYEDVENVCLIRDRLRTTQSRQISFADMRRRVLEFVVDD